MDHENDSLWVDHGFTADGQRILMREPVGSKPLTIAMILMSFLFVVLLGFYLSPLFLCKRTHMPGHRPRDLEDVAFKNEKPRLSILNRSKAATPTLAYNALEHDTDGNDNGAELTCHVSSGGTYYISRKRSLIKPVVVTTLTSRPSESGLPVIGLQRTLTPPPPAYTPSESAGTCGSFHSRTLSATSNPPAKKRPFLAIPKFMTRSNPAPNISNPIPQPEGPLPGPRISMEFQPVEDRPRIIFVRPCGSPCSGSDSILHPLAIYLPSPSSATSASARSIPLSSVFALSRQLDGVQELSSSHIGLAL